jgi:3-hydroxy acid dehydrogenase/malonic semialdehyde reductase
MNIQFATNVTGLVNMTQTVLPIFQKRPDGGAGDIINIGSIAGREAYPGGSIYCATKAAVRSFTDALRKELIATRIRVIEIDPGQVETVSLESRWWDVAEHLLTMSRNSRSSDSMETRRRLMRFMRKLSAIFADRTNLSRGCEPLTPDDIAEVVVFAAGRRENVVLADTLIFPNHQVSFSLSLGCKLTKSGRCYCHAQEVID